MINLEFHLFFLPKLKNCDTDLNHLTQKFFPSVFSFISKIRFQKSETEIRDRDRIREKIRSQIRFEKKVRSETEPKTGKKKRQIRIRSEIRLKKKGKFETDPNSCKKKKADPRPNRNR